MEPIELIFDNNTVIEDVLKDAEIQHVVTIKENTDLDKIKDLLVQVSDLPDSGFKFFDIRFKALSSEEKSKILKFSFICSGFPDFGRGIFPS